MKPPSQPVWYSLAAILFCFVLITLGGTWYVSHSQRKADHDWCELLDILTTDGPAPATPRGRLIAEAIERLKDSKGC